MATQNDLVMKVAEFVGMLLLLVAGVLALTFVIGGTLIDLFSLLT